MISETKIFVAVEQRVDGTKSYFSPDEYVRLSLDGERVNRYPSTARMLARQLKRFADMADPPKPRKKKNP